MLEPVVCPIHPPVLLNVPVSSKKPPEPSNSLVPPPCLLALEEQVFTMDRGKRKSCLEKALHVLIPSLPIAISIVKVLYPPLEGHAPGWDAQPLEEAGGLGAESWAQILLFLDLRCHRFSICDQEGPVKCINGQNLDF